MEVTVAKTAGFCFGVKRAVEKVYEQIGKSEKPIYTYGPIIHNEQVVGDLREKGVEVIDSLEELKTLRDAVSVYVPISVVKATFPLYLYLPKIRRSTVLWESLPEAMTILQSPFFH